ncbi:hypothetical protein KIL84_002983 [Mauremys mutica]|uniref:Uncharacterized protein n=1 Tax=Mauremys mutica TaxID=74926 RepID=A0A9D3WVA9_9SAUR|nr:hypothetical protein KIL84_002983 [Mauremys mutica]
MNYAPQTMHPAMSKAQHELQTETRNISPIIPVWPLCRCSLPSLRCPKTGVDLRGCTSEIKDKKCNQCFYRNSSNMKNILFLYSPSCDTCSSKTLKDQAFNNGQPEGEEMECKNEILEPLDKDGDMQKRFLEAKNRQTAWLQRTLLLGQVHCLRASPRTQPCSAAPG